MAEPWQREEIIGDCRLLLGDCLDILPTLGKVDAVVTDPPYGIGYKHGGGGGGKHSRRNTAPIHGDDAPFDPTPWLGFPEVILFGGDHYAQHLPKGRWLVWDKLDGVPSYDNFSDVEVAWLNRPGASRIIRCLWKGICQAKEADPTRYHPSQKPIAVMTWCLSFIQASTILDPFMGSGTTGVACVKLGRRFIGIEIDEGYFEIAVKRIREAYRQGDLFVERSSEKAVQEPLFSEAAE